MKKSLSVVAVSLAALLGFLAQAHAGDQDERNDPAFKKYEKKVVKLADEIQDKVAAMRGLKYQAPVPKGVATEAELKKSLIDEFDKPENVKDAETEGQVAKAFGLVPQDFDYRKEMRDLLADQIAGFYDPEAKRLRLVKKAAAAEFGEQAQEANDEMIMAHELEHALQDQNFDLKRWDMLLGDHKDRAGAWKCVVEGEATIVGFRFLFEKMGAPCPDMKTLWQMNNSMAGMDPNAAKQKEKMDALPAFLTRNLLMSYEQGSEFVETVYNKGGWDAVTKLFQDPPSSTAQILHPKKYFEHVEPREISMPALAKMVKGTEIDQSTMGEANVRLILEGRGQKKKAARTIASGWAGDRYQYFTDENKKPVLVWLTTWEDETKAKAFEDAYRAGLEKARAGKFSLERRATEVLYVDAEDAATRDKVAPKAWLCVYTTEHLKPFPSMFEKPPLKDFTEANESSGLGVASSAPLGDAWRDEELGVTFRLPAGFKKADEPIGQIKDFSRGLYKGKSADLRVIDLPMPFDKETLLSQFESFVKKGTKDFKKSKEAARTVGGHDGFELEFEGVIPDGSEEKREAKAVVVERDGMTFILILTAKKGGLADALPGFEAAVNTLRFIPAKLANEKQVSFGDETFAASPTFSVRSEELGALRLETPDKQARIELRVAPSAFSDLDKDRNETEQLRATHLPGYKSLGTSTFSHESLGMVYTSDYEVESKDGARKHVHELVALAGGKRIQLTCMCAPEAYDKWRPGFERAIWTLRAGSAPAVPEKKKDEKKPAADDEPF